MKRIIEILGVTVVVVGGFFVIKKMSGKTTPASTTTTEQAAADSAAKQAAAAQAAAHDPTLLELSVTLTTPSATQNVSNNGITDYEKTQIDKAIVQLKKPLPNNYYYDAQVLDATIKKIQDMDKATITVLESQAASNQEELFYTLVDNYAPPRKKHVRSTPIADPITGTGGNYVDKINSHMGFYGVK